jgi:hypothetical protein
MPLSLPFMPVAAPRVEPTDAELDAYILTRLSLAGVDLSVLPSDDPSAPADRRRILQSARAFLRGTPPVLRELAFGLQDAPPSMYPAADSSVDGGPGLPGEGA